MKRLFLCLNLTLYTFLLQAETVYLEGVVRSNFHGGHFENQKFKVGEQILLMRSKSFSEDSQLTSETHYFRYDGSPILSVFWFKDKGFSYAIRPDSPVMVELIDENNDGVMDVIIFTRENDGAQEKVFSFFLTEELGMIPAVPLIVADDGTSYTVDLSKRSIVAKKGK